MFDRTIATKVAKFVNTNNTITGNEQFSLFIAAKQYSFPWKTSKVCCLIAFFRSLF